MKFMAWVGMPWWEQAGLDLEGEREKAEAVEKADGDGMGSDRGKRGRLLL